MKFWTTLQFAILLVLAMTGCARNGATMPKTSSSPDAAQSRSAEDLRRLAMERRAVEAAIWGMPAADRKSRITELLTHFGLADRASEAVGDWSRGMKQKVALARALLHRPDVVFLDEPTAGLDPVASVALRTDLLDLARREGVTVFITTHNLDEAERICDRVGVIRGDKKNRAIAVAVRAHAGKDSFQSFVNRSGEKIMAGFEIGKAIDHERATWPQHALHLRNGAAFIRDGAQ